MVTKESITMKFCYSSRRTFGAFFAGEYLLGVAIKNWVAMAKMKAQKIMALCSKVAVNVWTGRGSRDILSNNTFM